MDAEILAISVDHIYSHQVFNASLGMLPYPLLSDWHKQTVKDYGVFDQKKETAIRSVFLVNKQGIIQYINTSFDAAQVEDYEEVFKQLERME